MLNIERRCKAAVRILPSSIGWFPRTRRDNGGALNGDEAAAAPRQRVAFEPASFFWKVTAHGTEPGRPRGLLLAWPRWERFAHSIWPTQKIPGSPQDLLHVRMVPYQGESLTLPDGTEIQPGMTVGELHCNNQAMLELVRNNGNPYRAMRDDLRSLARWISQPGFDINVEAFFGITLIANAAARIGFSVRARPMNLRLRLDRIFMTGLLLLYTIDGLTRIDKGTTSHSYPREVWLSRRELLRRYGNRGARRAGFPISRHLSS
ncbi:MAG: YkoP family protein [Candidatus Binataceae bacterium]